MLWERISAKPTVTILFFKTIDKTGNFAVLIFCPVAVPANQCISTQIEDPIYFKIISESTGSNSKIAMTNQRWKNACRASFRVLGLTR